MTLTLSDMVLIQTKKQRRSWLSSLRRYEDQGRLMSAFAGFVFGIVIMTLALV